MTVIANDMRSDCRPYVQFFLYLQLLDFFTTMVGIRLGLQESSPFIRHLMTVDPVVGVALSKVIAILLGGICLWTERVRLIRWIDYWYAALVVWNLTLILHAWPRA